MEKAFTAILSSLGKCRGEKETVALIYCDNEKNTTSEAFVGDSAKCAMAISYIFDRVGIGTASPADSAIAYAILWGVAAADVRHKGQLTAAIEEHIKDLKEGKVL